MASINDLDDICLVEIFSHLPIVDRIRLPHVCKKWLKPSKLMSWSNVKSLSTLSITHERLGPDYQTEAHIEAVLSKCGQYLKHLTLDCNFDSSIMPIVIKYCTNLTSIYINFHRTYEDDFIDAFTNMKKLKSIRMVYWSVPGENDTSILETLPKTIEKISFGVYPLIISPLAENFACTLLEFRGLRSLSLARTYLGIEVVEVISQLQQLVHLNLEGTQWDDDNNPNISNLVNLEYLDLSNGPIDDYQLIPIMKKCKKLKILQLFDCDNVSDELLHMLDNIKTLTLRF